LVSGLKPATVFSRSVYTRVEDAKSTTCVVEIVPERSALTVCSVTELASTLMDSPTEPSSSVIGGNPTRSVAPSLTSVLVYFLNPNFSTSTV
jgi:hypothetical protein